MYNSFNAYASYHTYYWMHVPSGQIGTATKTAAEIINEVGVCAPWEIRHRLMELLNNWNRLGKGEWKYWL